MTPSAAAGCDTKIADRCPLYQQAPALADQGERVVSTDELTGVQALERRHPGLPLAPGPVLRREFEYRRHGTGSCIVSRAVVSGQVVAPAVGPTGTEADFLAHIPAIVAADPLASRWHVVADNRNTHGAASRVTGVATVSGCDRDRGVKGKAGILHTRHRRAAFLNDPAHRLVCHYTPRHCSWMNQGEIWRSMLVRKLLRRGSFTSVADRQTQVVAFIAY